MFDFWKFYHGLQYRTSPIDNYWDQFPKGRNLQFKSESLGLLKDIITRKNEVEMPNILTVIYHDGADKDYTDILLSVLEDDWHKSEEDIVGILELIKDPKSVNKLYDLAINIPDYDDMRALAIKSMWALSAINTWDAKEKLKLLQKSDDPIISENATFQLEQLTN
jgi:hypothetical protein